jgi:hypothetical protein
VLGKDPFLFIVRPGPSNKLEPRPTKLLEVHGKMKEKWVLDQKEPTLILLEKK